VDNQFEPLAMGEVLSVDESVQILIGHRTFRVGEFAEAIRMQLEYGTSGWTSDKDAWFSEHGIPCEVLRFTANGWQKGKVRISLEFCPQDSEDENDYVSTGFDHELAIAAPTYSEDELDLVESPLSDESASFDNELALEVPAESEDELDLLESPLSMEDELDEVEPSIIMDIEDEPDLVDPQINDEFELGIPAASTNELVGEAPTAIYVEMELEVSTLDSDDELYSFQTPTSLDDELDLGEISQSIEQELELVEEPAASDDDLLDLGDMSDLGDLSIDGNDDFDFGEMSAGAEDEFEFGDISSSEKLEDNDTDSLLDDVWQDMNEASWQNNQY